MVGNRLIFGNIIYIKISTFFYPVYSFFWNFPCFSSGFTDSDLNF